MRGGMNHSCRFISHRGVSSTSCRVLLVVLVVYLGFTCFSQNVQTHRYQEPQ